MSCECHCRPTVVHTAAIVEQLQAELDRLKRDLAREIVDRADSIRSVRKDVFEVLCEERDNDIDGATPIPYALTIEGRMAIRAAL